MNEDKIREQLNEDLEALSMLGVGTTEREKMMCEITELNKILNEKKDSKKDIWEKVSFGIETGVKIGAIVIPLLFYSKTVRQMTEFEESGRIPVHWGFKNTLNKIK